MSKKKNDHTGDLPPEMIKKIREQVEANAALSKKAERADIEIDILGLVVNEPFFGAVTRRMLKTKTSAIGTAGVGWDGEQLCFYWSPFFRAMLNDKETKGLLKHEVYHIVFEHIGARRREPHVLSNIAQDCAINSIIDEHELPSCGIIPGKMSGSGPLAEAISRFPKEKSAEWYFNRLVDDEEVRKHVEECEGKGENPMGSGGPNMDNHGLWDEMSDEEKAHVQAKVREALEAAVREADHSNGWGSVPSAIREHLRDLLSTQVDWRDLMKNFIGRTVQSHRRNSIKRINKRYPYIHPGTTRAYTARIFVAIDMSGSVSNEALELFFGELNNGAKKTEFIVAPFDTEIDEDNIFVWKKGQKVKAFRARCGGTDFNAPTKFINEQCRFGGPWAADGLLVLTDGQAPKPVPCKVRRAWVICPGDKLYFETDETLIQMEWPKDSKKHSGDY